MPKRMINEKDEEIYFGNKEPVAQTQDCVIEHVNTTHKAMGSKAPAYTVITYREVFSPALKASRLAEEKRIADEIQAVENARLTKNAKAKVRRYHNKTFDERVAVLAQESKKVSIKLLRQSAKERGIDTKELTKKADLALAIATDELKERDAVQYQLTNYNTKFEEGVPQ